MTAVAHALDSLRAQRDALNTVIQALEQLDDVGPLTADVVAELPYECDVCGRCWQTSQARSLHRRRAHPVESGVETAVQAQARDAAARFSA